MVRVGPAGARPAGPDHQANGGSPNSPAPPTPLSPARRKKGSVRQIHALEQAELAEAGPAGARYDDMVVQADPEDEGRVGDAPRRVDVPLARLGAARGMVVHEDEAGGAHF